MHASLRASGQRDCQVRKPHPDGRRSSQPCWCRRKGGACRLSSPGSETRIAESECVRGHPRHKPRPQERAGAARGTERVNCSAPLLGVLRGVPAEGVAGDMMMAPGQGKAFPSRHHGHSVTLWASNFVRERSEIVVTSGDERCLATPRFQYRECRSAVGNNRPLLRSRQMAGCGFCRLKDRG